MFRNMKLRNKILIPIGIVLVIVFSIMTFVIVTKVSSMSENTAQELSQEMA